MADNTIQLKIIIDGRDANASIQLTNQNVQELYKAFRYGQQEVIGRFIPAHTGNASPAKSISAMHPVHPRAHGERWR